MFPKQHKLVINVFCDKITDRAGFVTRPVSRGRSACWDSGERTRLLPTCLFDWLSDCSDQKHGSRNSDSHTQLNELWVHSSSTSGHWITGQISTLPSVFCWFSGSAEASVCVWLCVCAGSDNVEAIKSFILTNSMYISTHRLQLWYSPWSVCRDVEELLTHASMLIVCWLRHFPFTWIVFSPFCF